MKMMAILLALFCILESTVLPACAKQIGEASSFSLVDNDDNCCETKKTDCTSDEQHDGKDCNSACSPFQSCGCCKVAFNGMIHPLPFIDCNINFDYSKQIKVRVKENLPDIYPNLPERPPKTA